MRKFTEEIEKEYPEWFEEEEVVVKKVEKKVPVKVREPLYVFPMILTIIVMGLYLGYMHIKLKENCTAIKNSFIEIKDSHLEIDKKFNKIEKNMDESRNMLNMMGVLHNENFSSFSLATGNKRVLYINPDWTIDRLPLCLSLTEEEIKYMKERYLKKDLTED